MIKEFKDFIAKGNVMDMAVGIIIGAAFTAIVGSLVADMINPLIGLSTAQIAAFLTCCNAAAACRMRNCLIR